MRIGSDGRWKSADIIFASPPFIATCRRLEDLPVWRKTAAQLFDACDDFLAEAAHRLREIIRNQLDDGVLRMSKRILPKDFDAARQNELLSFIYVPRG